MGGGISLSLSPVKRASRATILITNMIRHDGGCCPFFFPSLLFFLPTGHRREIDDGPMSQSLRLLLISWLLSYWYYNQLYTLPAGSRQPWHDTYSKYIVASDLEFPSLSSLPLSQFSSSIRAKVVHTSPWARKVTVHQFPVSCFLFPVPFKISLSFLFTSISNVSYVCIIHGGKLVIIRWNLFFPTRYKCVYIHNYNRLYVYS